MLVKSSFLRLVVVVLICLGVMETVHAQGQCVAWVYHYGGFGDPVTDRGPANRGPLVSATPQGAVDLAMSWVAGYLNPAEFTSRCGANTKWRAGPLQVVDTTKAVADVRVDREGPYCGSIERDVYIGGVTCLLGTKLSIEVLGSADIRPAETGGQSEITIKARVSKGVSGVPGIPLSFHLLVKPRTGGHDHDSVTRPPGKLTPTQAVTNANGDVLIVFKAPEFSGIHVIRAKCQSCSNGEVGQEVQVKVPDLLPISPNPPLNDDGTYAYALTSVDKTHQGNGRYHVNQYYLTPTAQVNLQSLITSFSEEGWGTVALNDASLYWGGRYDIESNWGGSHKGHREGREIDVSFARAGNRISSSKQNIYYDKFCKGKKASFPFSILHHYVRNPHFHMYLEKQTACWKSEK